MKHANHVFPVEMNNDAQFLQKGWDSLLDLPRDRQEPVIKEEDEGTEESNKKEPTSEKQDESPKEVT